MLSCSPVRAFLRRKNIYFRSENGSSKPSHRISHFQLELDKLPYVITRLKPICHRWNATSQLGKCLTCCTASQRCLKPHRASATPTSDPPIHSQTPQDSPSCTRSPLHSPFQPFSFILQSLTSISKPSILLFLTHTHSFFFYSKAAPAWIRGRWFASCKACDLHRITQINSPKFILSNQHTNLH